MITIVLKVNKYLIIYTIAFVIMMFDKIFKIIIHNWTHCHGQWDIPLASVLGTKRPLAGTSKAGTQPGEHFVANTGHRGAENPNASDNNDNIQSQSKRCPHQNIHPIFMKWFSKTHDITHKSWLECAVYWCLLQFHGVWNILKLILTTFHPFARQ